MRYKVKHTRGQRIYSFAPTNNTPFASSPKLRVFFVKKKLISNLRNILFKIIPFILKHPVEMTNLYIYFFKGLQNTATVPIILPFFPSLLLQPPNVNIESSSNTNNRTLWKLREQFDNLCGDPFLSFFLRGCIRLLV